MRYRFLRSAERNPETAGLAVTQLTSNFDAQKPTSSMIVYDYRLRRLGPYKLMPRERLLERDGARVVLGGRALDILIILLERRKKSSRSANSLSVSGRNSTWTTAACVATSARCEKRWAMANRMRATLRTCLDENTAS
jgi:hypothetical protein